MVADGTRNIRADQKYEYGKKNSYKHGHLVLK